MIVVILCLMEEALLTRWHRPGVWNKCVHQQIVWLRKITMFTFLLLRWNVSSFFFFFHEMLKIYICFSKESKPDLFILRTKRLHFTHLSGKDDRLWSQATWVHSQVLYLLTVWPWISLSFLICKMGVDNTIELYEDEMSDVCKIHSGVPGIQ